jgi:hypothetical protein
MWNFLEAVAMLIHWQFGAGLVVGFILTLRYVVIGFYHPIMREMEALRDARKNDDP